MSPPGSLPNVSADDANSPGKVIEPSPLDYRAPESERRTAPLIPGLVRIPWGLVLIPWVLVVTVACVFVIPRFELFYRDFGTKLPTMTIYAVQFSHIFNSFGWLAVWTFTLVIPFVASRARADYPGKTLWWRGVMLAVLLSGSTAAITWFAMQLPMVTILQTVTAGPRK